VLIKSQSLKEALNELDWSHDSISITLSPDPPYFRLVTSGVSSNCHCQVDYPKDSEVFEAFSCQQTQQYNYKSSLLLPTVKALSQSTRTQVRMNQNGLLQLQHMYRREDKKTTFIDFILTPETDQPYDDESAVQF